MKVIVTNDDGIAAPGLAALERIVARFATPVVVAPAEPMSGVAHRTTRRGPLRVQRLGPARYSVEGTPADCTRLALKEFAPDAAWVVAGINPGANLGSDVYNSGTVAAAREAAILQCPAVALSQYISPARRIDWAVTEAHAARVLAVVLKRPLAPGRFWNVNLPHPLECDDLPPIRFCRLDPHPHRYHYRRQGAAFLYQGRIHDRPRDPRRDVAQCFGGAIAVSRLNLDGCADSLDATGRPVPSWSITPRTS